MVLDVQRLSRRRQRIEEEPTKQGPQLARAGHRPEHDFFTRTVGEIGGERGSEIRRDQQLLHLLEQRVVDGPVGVQDGAETTGEVLLRSAQPVAETLTQGGEKLHWLSEGRTNRVMTAPLAPSRGIDRPLSSRLTPPALPIVMTNGPFEIHSRISLAGIVSSLVRPSSVRTRIQVVSVVLAMSRYGEATPRTVVAAAVGADGTAGIGVAAGGAVAVLGTAGVFGAAGALGAAGGLDAAGALATTWAPGMGEALGAGVPGVAGALGDGFAG